MSSVKGVSIRTHRAVGDKITIAGHLLNKFKDALLGCGDQEVTKTLLQLVEAETGPQQLACAKKQASVLKQLKEDAVEWPCMAVTLEVLVQYYLQAALKNPLKRVFASMLQKLPQSFHGKVALELKAQVVMELEGRNDVSMVTPCRQQVNMISGLLENFPLGEACLKIALHHVVGYLTSALGYFIEKAEHSASPLEQTERMHDCMAVIQVSNRLLQKCAAELTSLLTNHSEEQQTLLRTQLSKLLMHAWKILQTESFLLDCRGACGMAVPLILKTILMSSTLPVVRKRFFPSHPHDESVSVPEWLLGGADASFECGTLPVDSYVGLCAGFAAMMTPEDLLAHDSTSGIFLVDVLANELFLALNRCCDTNTKLVSSRAFLLWTVRASSILSETCVVDEVRSSFQGTSATSKMLLAYAFNQWEESAEVLRYQAGVIFENMIKLHLLTTKEDPKGSSFILDMTEQLLEMSWHCKGKYSPVGALVGHLGASRVLYLRPQLPSELLRHAAEQQLATYVCELYERLLSCAKSELCEDNTSSGGQDVWRHLKSVFLTPVVQALQTENRAQKLHILEYLLPKLLKNHPEVLPLLIHQLSEKNTDLGSLLTCLKRGRSMGLIRQDEGHGEMWNKVVPVTVLKQSLCHHDDQIRLDALGLLCENSKTTQAVTKTDLDLVLKCFSLNLNNQSPAFRQQLAALMKKFLLRLKESGNFLHKQLQRERAKRAALGNRADNLPADLSSQPTLQNYKMFLSGLCDSLFNALHPKAAFPSRTSAVANLTILRLIFGLQEKSADDDGVLFHLIDCVSPSRVQTLLECLTDTFEYIKTEAYAFLMDIPCHLSGLQDKERLGYLMSAGLELASSSKPQNSSTAAYLLRILLHYEALDEVLIEEKLKISQRGQGAPALESMECKDSDSEGVPTEENVGMIGDGVPPKTSYDSRQLEMVSLLLMHLREQVGVAGRNLLHASATRPMYPTLHCIRYILADANLRAKSSSVGWRRLLKEVIDTCYQVSQVVSPVMSNSSPEGNIPTESFMDGGMSMDDAVGVENMSVDQELLAASGASEEMVKLMPEYLVVCCWRSVKEVSLLLGQLTQDAPVQDPGSNDTMGLLTCQQVLSIGDYFTSQLLESIHRGAFELAYAGFVKMCDMLWNSKLASLHKLPQQWLEKLLCDISSGDPESKLCATRRSAGVPFYLQALITTEPAITGRSCIKLAMKELLQMALAEGVDLTVENTPQIHSLNIVRALFRDTRLREDVVPYIEDGLRASILGFYSQFWAIRNSATLLFGALTTRIFGVKRGKEEQDRKNCMTGRFFFSRFPSLFQFLLDQLKDATENMGGQGQFRLHPGLYPTLMVLGRLFPALREGSDSSLNLAAFVPYIIKCASSPVYKTRIMAARALRPLVSKDLVPEIIKQLLGSLLKARGAGISHNYIHGILLQVEYLLKDCGELPAVIRLEVEDVLIQGLLAARWISTRENACLLTRAAFLQILSQVWSEEDEEEENPSAARQELLRLTCDAITLELTWTNHYPPHTPGLCQFQQVLANLALLLVSTPATEVNKEERKETDHNFDDDAERDDDDDVDDDDDDAGGDDGDGGSGDVSNIDDNTKVSATHLGSKEILWSKENIILLLLRSEFYEVRLQVLIYLRSSALTGQGDTDMRSGEDCEDEGNSEKVIQRSMSPGGQKGQFHSVGILQCLVSMLMRTEKHERCLTEALLLLSEWPDFQEEQELGFPTLQVFKVLNTLQEQALRDEVRCAALMCSGNILSLVLKLSQQPVVAEGCGSCPEMKEEVHTWLRLVCESSAIEQSTDLRYSAAKVIIINYQLLTDLNVMLGGSVFQLWSAVVRLLQDDDVEVREVMAEIIIKLREHLQPAQQALCSNPIQPELALDWCVQIMITYHMERRMSDCFHALTRWLADDLYDNVGGTGEDQEERLFDRGEMNTYDDAVIFVDLVAKHLRAFLKPATSPALSANSEQLDELVSTKKSEICNTLRTQLKKNGEQDLQKPFVDPIGFQNELLEFYRLMTSLHCLSEFDESESGIQKRDTLMTLQKELFQPRVPNTLLDGLSVRGSIYLGQLHQR